MRKKKNPYNFVDYIRLLGKLTAKSVKLINASKGEKLLFVDYNGTGRDLPIGTVFCIGEKKMILETVCDAPERPFEEGIPQGFKTICRFKYPDGPIQEIEQLDTVDLWHEGNYSVTAKIKE